MTALVLTDMIDQSSSRTKKQRIIQAQFGDGYSQETPDGINSILETWSLRWSNLTTSERDTLVAMLDSVGSTGIITWTPQGETEKTYKMTPDGYSESWSSGDLHNISLSLRQVK
jgi:phage-related protein